MVIESRLKKSVFAVLSKLFSIVDKTPDRKIKGQIKHIFFKIYPALILLKVSTHNFIPKKK